MRRLWILRVRSLGLCALIAVAAGHLKASGALLASSPRVGRGPVCQVESQEQATNAGEKGTERRKVLIRLIRKADGKPISGATVVVTSYNYVVADGYLSEYVLDEELERLTDEKGCCLIEAPGDVSGLGMWSAKDGYCPVSFSVQWKGKTGFAYTTAQGTARHEVPEGTVPTAIQELEPGEAVGGLVKDVEGRAIEGAEVTVAFDGFGRR